MTNPLRPARTIPPTIAADLDSIRRDLDARLYRIEINLAVLDWRTPTPRLAAPMPEIRGRLDAVECDEHGRPSDLVVDAQTHPVPPSIRGMVADAITLSVGSNIEITEHESGYTIVIEEES
jgi:hypothetical protein